MTNTLAQQFKRSKIYFGSWFQSFQSTTSLLAPLLWPYTEEGYQDGKSTDRGAYSPHGGQEAGRGEVFVLDPDRPLEGTLSEIYFLQRPYIIGFIISLQCHQSMNLARD
jgi:hypothetical protein